MVRVQERRRKRSSGNNKDSIPRVYKGQRKEGRDLTREKGKMKMVPGMISGESSTEDIAQAIRRV